MRLAPPPPPLSLNPALPPIRYLHPFVTRLNPPLLALFRVSISTTKAWYFFPSATPTRYHLYSSVSQAPNSPPPLPLLMFPPSVITLPPLYPSTPTFLSSYTPSSQPYYMHKTQFFKFLTSARLLLIPLRSTGILYSLFSSSSRNLPSLPQDPSFSHMSTGFSQA